MFLSEHRQTARHSVCGYEFGLCRMKVETLGRYAEDFSSLVLHSELLTPEDIEAQYNVSGGHWHHGDPMP